MKADNVAGRKGDEPAMALYPIRSRSIISDNRYVPKVPSFSARRLRFSNQLSLLWPITVFASLRSQSFALTAAGPPGPLPRPCSDRAGKWRALYPQTKRFNRTTVTGRNALALQCNFSLLYVHLCDNQATIKDRTIRRPNIHTFNFQFCFSCAAFCRIRADL